MILPPLLPLSAPALIAATLNSVKPARLLRRGEAFPLLSIEGIRHKQQRQDEVHPPRNRRARERIVHARMQQHGNQSNAPRVLDGNYSSPQERQQHQEQKWNTAIGCEFGPVVMSVIGIERKILDGKFL